MASTTIALDHVGVTVSDLDRSIALLERCFGFALTSRGGRPAGLAERLTGVPGAEVEIAFVAGPGVVIELLCYARPPVRQALPAPHHPGAAHLALRVPDIAAVLAAGEPLGLRRLGEVLRMTAGPNAGGQVAYAQHDAGLTLELIQPQEKI